MTEEQDKRKEVKEEPTKAEQVKKESSEVDLEGVSGGFKPHQWPKNPTQVPVSQGNAGASPTKSH